MKIDQIKEKALTIFKKHKYEELILNLYLHISDNKYVDMNNFLESYQSKYSWNTLDPTEEIFEIDGKKYQCEFINCEYQSHKFKYYFYVDTENWLYYIILFLNDARAVTVGFKREEGKDWSKIESHTLNNLEEFHDSEELEKFLTDLNQEIIKVQKRMRKEFEIRVELEKERKYANKFSFRD
jgi:hypothetical protein